jgi:transcriptional regulator with XRE-family HTH domain
VDGAAVGPGELAVRLRGWRLAAALSQEELAARAGLTAKAIGALERGERRRPYPHTVRALAEALALDEEDRAALAAAAAGAGTEHRPALPARIPDPGPGPGTSDAEPLPVPPAPLVGRQLEHDRAVAELRSGQFRLLTLTGPGGVGKTRLALEVARTLAGDFPGAVTVVELAPVPEARLVLPTVARAVGGLQLSGPAVTTLAAALGARRQLLLLDNLEHVLDVAGELAELLARCSGLHVLATSRAALRIRAEHAVPLDPLPVPATDDVADVAASPAVQVFLDRAVAAGSTVPLDRATAADVAAICRRLDGLPLALELAAAHARYLTPSALLSHLDRAVGSPRSRDLPARQRTVRATLDWSHGLLTHQEQVLLRRLSVLPGSFSLPAAVAVGGDDVDVLTALAGLVEQSLLAPSRAPSPGTARWSPSGSTRPRAWPSPAAAIWPPTVPPPSSPRWPRARTRDSADPTRPPGSIASPPSTPISARRWRVWSTPAASGRPPGWAPPPGSTGRCAATPRRASPGWSTWPTPRGPASRR